ncbi:hypothetical protein HK097_003556, partial [Rhizophlyctis rosea]
MWNSSSPFSTPQRPQSSTDRQPYTPASAWSSPASQRSPPSSSSREQPQQSHYTSPIASPFTGLRRRDFTSDSPQQSSPSQRSPTNEDSIPTATNFGQLQYNATPQQRRFGETRGGLTSPTTPITSSASPNGGGRKEESPQEPVAWEHPAVQDVFRKRYRGTFNDVDRKTLTLNGAALGGLAFFWAVGLLEYFVISIEDYTTQQAGYYLEWFFTCLAILLTVNILHCLIKFLRPAPTFANYALTPVQRRKLGLDPNVKTPASAKLKYAHASPPRSSRGDGTGSPSLFTSEGRRYGSCGRQDSSPSQRPDTTPSRPRGPLSLSSPLASYLLTTSPVSLHEDYIKDPASLEQMLRDAEREDQNPEDTSDNRPTEQRYDGSGQSASPFATAGGERLKYQPAVKPVNGGVGQVVRERIEDGLVFKNDEQTLVDWNVEKYVYEWGDNIRSWLAAQVIKPLARRIEEMDATLANANLRHLDCRGASSEDSVVVVNSGAGAPVSALTNSMFGGTSTTGFGTSMFGARPAGGVTSFPTATATANVQTLNDFFRQFAGQVTVLERKKLEVYLSLRGYKCRAYIVDRIKALAKGNSLVSFQWNGGMGWEGKEWTPEGFPTDAQLVMHLFCRYLDEITPQADMGMLPFSKEYFVGEGEKPDRTRFIQIRQYKKYPPHYHLVLDGTVYDVRQ